jgi:hypothetical protein
VIESPKNMICYSCEAHTIWPHKLCHCLLERISWSRLTPAWGRLFICWSLSLLFPWNAHLCLKCFSWSAFPVFFYILIFVDNYMLSLLFSFGISGFICRLDENTEHSSTEHTVLYVNTTLITYLFWSCQCFTVLWDHFMNLNMLQMCALRTSKYCSTHSLFT